MEHRFASTILITFLIMIITYMVLRKCWNKSKVCNSSTPTNLPPGPSKLPLIGSLHHLFGSNLPHRRLRELAKKFGPVMHLQLGQVTHIVISSAEAAKEVMKTHDVIFAQRSSPVAARNLTYDYTDILFAPYGDYWRQLRKICVLELLSAKRVQSFRAIREEEVSKVITSLSSSVGPLVNISRMFSSLTYCIISRVVFGEAWKGEDVLFIQNFKDIFTALGGFSLVDVYPSIDLLQVFSGTRRRLNKAHDQLDQLLENIINEHRAKKAVAKTGAEDLVDVLLNLQDQGDLQIPLTTNNIKAIIQDMFIGGSGTSSSTAAWAMSELAKNPRVMEKAQAEVRQVFGRKGNVDEAGLQELSYLKLVIKETLRLHPPGPLLAPRESREKCQIAGYNIPAHSKVIVNAWAIGRDPSCWINPEKFYPERFQDKIIDYRGTDFEYIPFGAGRRICPGILLALANLELPLAQLLFHFDWRLPSGLTSADLDMSEVFGLAVHRKNELYLSPIPHLPLPVN